MIHSIFSIIIVIIIDKIIGNTSAAIFSSILFCLSNEERRIVEYTDTFWETQTRTILKLTKKFMCSSGVSNSADKDYSRWTALRIEAKLICFGELCSSRYLCATVTYCQIMMVSWICDAIFIDIRRTRTEIGKTINRNKRSCYGNHLSPSPSHSIDNIALSSSIIIIIVIIITSDPEIFCDLQGTYECACICAQYFIRSSDLGNGVLLSLCMNNRIPHKHTEWFCFRLPFVWNLISLGLANHFVLPHPHQLS